MERLKSYIKIQSLTQKRIAIFVFLVIAIVAIGFLIFSHNKKQEALYDKYMTEAGQSMNAESKEAETIGLFTSAINIYPNRSKAYAGRALAYYINNQNDEALMDTDKALSLTKDNPDFVYKLRGDIFKVQQKLEPAVEAYSKAYSISPSDRDSVHDYASVLVTAGQYDNAYTIIKKYFNETPSETYWNDVDVWQDRGVASAQTHRCTEAFVSSWHALKMSDEGSDNKAIAEATAHTALNDKECIDTGSKKSLDVEMAKNAVVKNEGV